MCLIFFSFQFIDVIFVSLCIRVILEINDIHHEEVVEIRQQYKSRLQCIFLLQNRCTTVIVISMLVAAHRCKFGNIVYTSALLEAGDT